MQDRPAKSASGRPKSRKHTASDIEEWVLQDCMLAQEKTRHSGHPPENITEERLLKTKLMELGKDRFKVLARLNTEKQTFIDKQRRKAFMMKKSRSDNKIKRTRITREASFEKDDIAFEVPQLGQRKDFTKGIRPKTVHFDTSANKSEYNTMSTKIRPHTVATNPSNIETTIISTDASQFMLDMSAPIPDSANEVEVSALDLSRPSTTSTSFSRSVSLLSESDISFRIPAKNRRNALRPVSITSEPRYAFLEKALSENYAGHCKLDVKTIIERTESLQRTSQRSGKEAKRALQEKIKQFMIDRDISFRHLVA